VIEDEVPVAPLGIFISIMESGGEVPQECREKMKQFADIVYRF